MRFRSSYSCGAAEDFPSITTSPAILDCQSFDFAQDKFWIQSKIQNQKSKTGVGGGAGRVTSFPYIRLRLMISLDLPPSLLSSMGIGKTKIDGNTDPAFHNFLTIAGWDEAPSLDRFLGSTIQCVVARAFIDLDGFCSPFFVN